MKNPDAHSQEFLFLRISGYFNPMVLPAKGNKTREGKCWAPSKIGVGAGLAQIKTVEGG